MSQDLFAPSSADRARALADALLSIDAVSLRPHDPFTWSSGLAAPIYCDNRQTLAHPSVRERIADGFAEAVREYDGTSLTVAGTATAGIPHAAWLADRIEAPMASLPTTGWAMAVGALMLHAASLAMGESPMVPSGKWTLLAVAYVGVVASSVGYGAYFTLMRRRGPFTANLVSYAVPPVASVTGWALLDERLPPLAIAGFSCILVGFLVLNREAVSAELGKLTA